MPINTSSGSPIKDQDTSVSGKEESGHPAEPVQPCGLLEEYSEEESHEIEAESDEEEALPLDELRSRGKQAVKDKDLSAAIDYASRALTVGVDQHDGDDMHPSLAELYLDYGDYLLRNYEENSEVLSGAAKDVAGGDAISKVQALIAAQAEMQSGEEGDDALAFQMLEVARTLLESNLTKTFPRSISSNLPEILPLVPPSSEAPGSPPSQPTLPSFSFLSSLEIPSDVIGTLLPAEDSKRRHVKNLAFVHRRLGELFVAQDLHVEALHEFLTAFTMLENRLEGGIHAAELRQVAVLLAQSLQWTGHLDHSSEVFTFAKRLYESIGTYTPNLIEHLGLSTAAVQDASAVVSDLNVVIDDLNKVRAQKKDVPVDSSSGAVEEGRVTAIKNAVPDGVLESMEGTRVGFDTSKFDASGTETMNVLTVRKKRPAPVPPTETNSLELDDVKRGDRKKQKNE